MAYGLKACSCHPLRSVGSTKIPFVSSSDDSLQDAYIIKKNVDDLEIVLKTFSILVWGTVPP